MDQQDKHTLIDVIKAFEMGTGNDFLPLMMDITKYAGELMSDIRSESDAELDKMIARYHKVQEEVKQEQNGFLEELELLYDKAAMNKIIDPASAGLVELKTFTMDIDASMKHVRDGASECLKNQQSNAELEFAHEKICATMFLGLSTSAFLKGKALGLIAGARFNSTNIAIEGMEKFLKRMGVET